MNKKIKTSTQLHKLIIETFTDSEIRNINPKIYLNSKYIEYYKNYHMGNYEYCFDFLINNRSLLK